MKHFLRLRIDGNGQTLDNLFDPPPLPQDEGWFRLAWRPMGQEAFTALSDSGWVRAWHGTKLEALHCIIHSGHLFESRHTECGERFFADAPGVYMHKGSLRGKAETYCRFVQLDPTAGLFFAVMWELLAN